MKNSITIISLLATLTTAHFELVSPAVRGFDEDNLPQFPCGGQNAISSKRTPFPLTNGTIALEMGHASTNLEVLLALGNAPTSAFNTILRPTFQLTALGPFCMTGFVIPEGLNVTAGMNATIQVQSNGDPEGGLYNCADITFVETLAQGEGGKCENATSIQISKASVSGHPNGTAYGAGGSGSATEPSMSGSASGTPAATTSPTSTPGAGVIVKVGAGGVLAAVVAAVAMVL